MRDARSSVQSTKEHILRTMVEIGAVDSIAALPGTVGRRKERGTPEHFLAAAKMTARLAPLTP